MRRHHRAHRLRAVALSLVGAALETEPPSLLDECITAVVASSSEHARQEQIRLEECSFPLRPGHADVAATSSAGSCASRAAPLPCRASPRSNSCSRGNSRMENDCPAACLEGRVRRILGWATPVDSLDTLRIMGLRDEIIKAVATVAEIGFGRSTLPRVDVLVTNTSGISAGGLLAAYGMPVDFINCTAERRATACSLKTLSCPPRRAHSSLSWRTSRRSRAIPSTSAPCRGSRNLIYRGQVWPTRVQRKASGSVM